MRDRILVTGGTGKTGRRVASLLAQRGVATHVATRTPQRPGQVRFDWLDTDTFEDALTGAAAIYLVAPGDAPDMLAARRPFMERTIARDVRRLVLLSAASIEESGPMMGAAHAWLRAGTPGWTVLRPSWFMQNFPEQQHLPTIRAQGAIYSATGDGHIPFIDADDIAAVAVEALLDPAFPNGDLVLTGPDALSYDAVATLISAAAGRLVEHRRRTVPEMAEHFERAGVPTAVAGALAAMDDAIANDTEGRTTGEVERITGRRPTSFAAFAAANVSVWRG